MLLEACDENSELIGQLLRGDVIHRGLGPNQPNQPNQGNVRLAEAGSCRPVVLSSCPPGQRARKESRFDATVVV